MMKFSIIVPCYNLERYIGEALDSVLKQTFGDYECIVVDDGSTDDSPRIIDEYAARDLRIRVIHKPNGGEGSARNAGLDVLQGEWIVYLDGDDVLSSDVLKVIADAIAGNPQIDLFSFDSRPFDDGCSPQFDGELRGSRLIDCRLVIPDSLGMIGVWQMVYRREKFGGLRFTRYKLGADLVYTSKCFAIVDSALLLGFVGHGYRLRAGSAVHSRMTKAKAMDDIGFKLEMFENFAASGKRLGRIFARSRGNAWIRDTVKIIDALDVEDRQSVFDHWLVSLESAKKMPFFSWWQRISVRLLLATKSRFVAKLLTKVRNPF